MWVKTYDGFQLSRVPRGQRQRTPEPAPHRIVRQHDAVIEADGDQPSQGRPAQPVWLENFQTEAVEPQIAAAVEHSDARA